MGVFGDAIASDGFKSCASAIKLNDRIALNGTIRVDVWYRKKKNDDQIDWFVHIKRECVWRDSA